jgi:hypothetical protein
MTRMTPTRPTEQIAEFFARSPSADEISTFHLSDETLSYVRELLYKNSAGTLSGDESQELDELMLLDRIMNLIRSRVPQAPSTNAHPSGDGMTSA